MQPKRYTYKEHSIQRHHIDEDALWIVERLQEAGHVAYIVGGSIRDILLGKTPKDFDISTSARPDEMKYLFQKRCLIIGKRFRLAHIRFGNKVIEVSTFRSGDPSLDDLIIRDNIWGTEDEDVFRRDFTINALYYDPVKQVIIDYVDGMSDISTGTLRAIGNPSVRFRQDPVRMLRMLKFQARFGFFPEDTTLDSLNTARYEISKSAPSRIFEELMKMLESGFSAPFFHLLDQHGFLEILLPLCQKCIQSPSCSLFYNQLIAIDHMMLQGYQNAIDRSCLLAALFFPIIEHDIFLAAKKHKGSVKMGFIFSSIEQLITSFIENTYVRFPRKITTNAFHILTHQFRLTPLRRNPKFSLKFPHNEEFRKALILLSIRASIDNNLCPLWAAWKKEYESRNNRQNDRDEESIHEELANHTYRTVTQSKKYKTYKKTAKATDKIISA